MKAIQRVGIPETGACVHRLRCDSLRWYSSLRWYYRIGACADRPVSDDTSCLRMRVIVQLSPHSICIAIVNNRTIADYGFLEVELRRRQTPSETGRSTICDRKEYHLRPEGVLYQTGRTTVSDRKDYHRRPEGLPSQTGLPVTPVPIDLPRRCRRHRRRLRQRWRRCR